MEENSNDPHLAPWLINEKGTKDICKISSDTVVNTFASVKKKMKKKHRKEKKNFIRLNPAIERKRKTVLTNYEHRLKEY